MRRREIVKLRLTRLFRRLPRLFIMPDLSLLLPTSESHLNNEPPKTSAESIREDWQSLEADWRRALRKIR